MSSELILEAEAATRDRFGEPPAEGFVTFVDPDKVRHKRDPGRCFLRAGWTVIGATAGGLVALGHGAAEIPAPLPAHGSQLVLL